MASQGSGMDKLRKRSSEIIGFPQDEFDHEVFPTVFNNIAVGLYRFSKGMLGKTEIVIYISAYWPDEAIGIRKSDQCFRNIKALVDRAGGKINLEDLKKPIGQLKVFRAVVRNLSGIDRGFINTQHDEAIRQRRTDRNRRHERQLKKDARKA